MVAIMLGTSERGQRGALRIYPLVGPLKRDPGEISATVVRTDIGYRWAVSALPTLRDPTGRWLIDRVFDSTDVDYRVWDRGALVGEFGNRADLEGWLKRAGVDVEKLKPMPGASKPWAKL
jgi:hypothetical protein